MIVDIILPVYEEEEGLPIFHEALSAVLADLSPHNVIVREDERRVVLIDFEAAFVDGVDAPTTLATPGFVSARRRTARNIVPTFSDDLYALGASMLSFIFRVTPHLEQRE